MLNTFDALVTHSLGGACAISFNEEPTKLRTWDIKEFIWGNKCENHQNCNSP